MEYGQSRFGIGQSTYNLQLTTYNLQLTTYNLQRGGLTASKTKLEESHVMSRRQSRLSKVNEQ